jgi:hypothetical protein
MLASRPNAPRIRELLREDAQLREDLARETDPDLRECIRQDLYATRHSLWLAGYQPEED